MDALQEVRFKRLSAFQEFHKKCRQEILSYYSCSHCVRLPVRPLPFSREGVRTGWKRNRFLKNKLPSHSCLGLVGRATKD
jgi:hypothetical protein